MKHHIVNVLYMQHISFGDVLVSTAILRKLREKHPNCCLHYYTSYICAPLLFGNPDVNRGFTERCPPTNLEGYDIILRPYRCLQSSGGWHLNDRHFMDLYADICGVALNGDYTTYFYDVAKDTELPCNKYVLIQCKTNDPTKDYDRFPELAQLITEKLKLKVFQIGGMSEPPISGTNGMITVPWAHTAHLIANAVVTITLDSAVQHLAGALNAPYIALYGPKNMCMVRSGMKINSCGGYISYTSNAPNQYGLEPTNRHGCDGPCNLAQCHNPSGKCINTIEPERILQLIDTIMQEG